MESTTAQMPDLALPATTSHHVGQVPEDLDAAMADDADEFARRPLDAGDALDNVEPGEQQQPYTSFRPLYTDDADSSVASDEERPYTLPPIKAWEELACIRLLNRFYQDDGVDNRGYEILYRMCQIAWAVGNEVAIRKKIKLPRAQRLAKFQHFFNSLLQGAKLWQRSLKAQIRLVCEAMNTLPDPSPMDAFQDLGPKLRQLRDAIR